MNDELPEAELASSEERRFRQARKERHIVLIVFLSIPLIFCILGYGCWRWKYPYGYRCCVSSLIHLDFATYAGDHDGWYPKGGATPLESLQKLCFEAAGCRHLAGFSGSEKKTVERLSSGGTLDETISSWVYYPGLREDDEDLLSAQGIKPKLGLALVWERRSGIGMGGVRAPEGSHLVIFSRESPTQIGATEWDSFLKEQEECRRVIFASRAQPSIMNTPPPRTN